MIRISQKDFDSLKGSNNYGYGGLYDHLMSISRNGTGTVVWSPADSTVYIKDEALGTAFRNLLAEWIRNNNIESVQVPIESAPVAPAPAARAPVDAFTRLQEAERVKLQEAAATARANYYVVQQAM